MSPPRRCATCEVEVGYGHAFWCPVRRARRNYAAPDRRGAVLGPLPWWWLLGHNLSNAGLACAIKREAHFEGFMRGYYRTRREPRPFLMADSCANPESRFTGLDADEDNE